MTGNTSAKDITPKRVTVHDVAHQAGVSLATVDRVLNQRSGVRAKTIEKVEQAIRALGFRRDVSASLLARARDINLHFILPEGANQFMANLAAAITEQTARATAERMHITTHFVPAFDGNSLSALLDVLGSEECDCAIIVAPDDPLVRQAVNAAVARQISVLTLVSDLPDTARAHFIGIDNRAAGRTAAALMGRFNPTPGAIGLVIGSLELADHRDRYDGFREVFANEFPHLDLIGPAEGFDEKGMTKSAVAGLIAEYPDIVGLYSMGAGNAGLIDALNVTGRAGRIKVIVHELTPSTRDALKSGTIDVVLDQNPVGEISAAITTARRIVMERNNKISSPKIEIGIFLRDNLR